MATYQNKNSKITKAESIANETLSSLSKRDNFLNYLKTASHLYKYDFYDSLMIHAQKPNATAVASFDLWNRLDRRVNYGTKGILLLKTNSRVANVKYAFDISDTNGEKIPYIWQIDDQNEIEIIDRLKNHYGFENKYTSLESLADFMVDEQMMNEGADFDQEFGDVASGSYFDDFSDEARSLWLNNVMADAIKSTVMLRCGYDKDEFDIENDFSHLENFNTPETMIFLGQKTSELSQNILHDIEVIAKDIEKNKSTERSVKNVDGQNKIQGKQSRVIDSTSGGDRPTDATTSETGTNAHEILGKQPQGEVFNTSAEGRTTHDLLQQAAASTKSDRPANKADEANREQSSYVDSKVTGNRKPSNQGSDSEQIKQDDIDNVLLNGTQFKDGKQQIIDFFHSNKSISDRADFIQSAYGIGGDSIEFEPNRYGYYSYDESGINVERGEQYDEPMRLSYEDIATHIDNLIQTERYFEQQNADEVLIKPSINQTDAFVEQDYINTVLLSGSGFEGGKQRIIDYFFANNSSKERADFLKNEYGTGGGSVTFANEQTGYHDHNAKGITIKPVFNSDNPIKLSWSKVVKHINELIKNEQYFKLRYPSEKPLIKPNSIYDDLIKISDQGAVNNAPFLMPENDTAIVNDDNYADLFDKIIKQGNVSKTGKSEILSLIEESSDSETIANELPKIFGDFWSEVKHNDQNIKWHVTPSGLEVFINGWEKPTLKYAWAEIAERTIHLYNNGEYLDDINEEIYTSDATDEPAEITTRLKEGMVVSLDDKNYRITKIDAISDSISLDDLSFAHNTGFPIIRKENLSSLERLLENDGFFEESKKQTTNKNFVISDNNLGVGSPKEKYQNNITAIKLLKSIENEDRFATPKEQIALSQYVGLGGLADVFDETKDSWSKEYNELQGLLTEQEYDNARASTLSSFYTQPIIIREMYNALSNMGLKRGNILEPSMGTGNFLGCMTDDFKNFNTYGVELDSLTGRIAKQLYPDSNIQIKGFEKSEFQDNFFDIAIGNVPFGNFGVPDSKYDKHKFYIHDYFFAKSLDKVRAGGIVAFITSKGTLDKSNSKVREYLSQRAELVGAVRLPNDAFKNNAGTQVTSDIIFLKKRDGIKDIADNWVQTGYDNSGVMMNQYFVDNPHMVLGSMQNIVGRFGEETACIAIDDGASFSEKLKGAITFIADELQSKNTFEFDIEEPEQEDDTIPADPNVKNYSYAITDDKVYFRENSIMTLANTSAKGEERIRGMIGIRQVLQRVIDYQVNGLSQSEIKEAQSELNQVYDEFVASYGRINTQANSRAFRDDDSYYLLSSIEILDKDNKFKEKADIFSKQTIRPVKEITRVDTASESLALSLANKGHVDIGYMSALTQKEPIEVINNLKGVIFKEPLSDMQNIFEGWKTSDEYLSGNVREKLRIAKEYDKHELVIENAKYLEEVQPKELAFDEINVKLGTVWIPLSDFENFIHETLKTPNYYKYDINVNYEPLTGVWNISNKSLGSDSTLASTTFGTDRKSAYHIIENALNLRSTNVYDRVIGDDNKVRSVKNKKETILANQKQTILQEEFKTWVWKDPVRRERLTKYYNENFNNIRTREYDGSHLNFDSMSPSIALRPHQKNAIARQIYGENTLLAHVVGAGKSFTMIAGAMEKKRLGLTSKNMFVVPNHLTEQMATEVLRLYPSANVLVTTKRDFQTKNRKRFCSKIATGEYDIVIIGHSQFEKIPLSADRQIRIISEQIEDIVGGISQLKRQDGQRFNIKQMESTKKKLEARLEKLNKNERKDDVITFEQLGIDGLYVDESHMYKNLFLYTKMNNVAGIQQTEAQKSTDMFMKCQYIDEITDGKGICFATGTPISNSMVEMYTVQRYLQMNELKRKGLHHFDSWASVFGESQTAFELSVDGNGFKTKTRFNKFHNLPELMNMFKDVADIQTADMLNLPVPKLKTGEVQTITIQPTDIQKKLIEGLGERADKIDRKLVKPEVDNMLNITNDGKKIALDQRLQNPLLPDDPNSKINTLMRNVYDIWEKSKDNKSTQLVFCDMSTPKGNNQFNVYDDLKQKWIDKGIPEEEIVFIQDTKNDIQKKSLFDKVRNGEVRILLGSTPMMGAGTNVQDKLIALHHADVPWRPSDLEQREGRILRQGNSNDEVEIFRYITKETFDSYSFQLIEQKQRFISQVMTSKSAVRSAEDVDDKALSYAEVKALATGNPLIKEKMELDSDVESLKLMKSQYINKIYSLETKLRKSLPAEIKRYEEQVVNFSEDFNTIQPYQDKEFSIILDGDVYDDKAKAGEKIINLCARNKSDRKIDIGIYKGMMLKSYMNTFGQVNLSMYGKGIHTIELGSDAHGNIQRMENKLKSLAASVDKFKQKIEIINADIKEAKVEVAKPFPQEDELRSKLVRLEELNSELSMDKQDDVEEIDDDAPANSNIQKGIER